MLNNVADDHRPVWWLHLPQNWCYSTYITEVLLQFFFLCGFLLPLWRYPPIEMHVNKFFFVSSYICNEDFMGMVKKNDHHEKKSDSYTISVTVRKYCNQRELKVMRLIFWESVTWVLCQDKCTWCISLILAANWTKLRRKGMKRNENEKKNTQIVDKLRFHCIPNNIPESVHFTLRSYNVVPSQISHLLIEQNYWTKYTAQNLLPLSSNFRCGRRCLLNFLPFLHHLPKSQLKIAFTNNKFKMTVAWRPYF